MFTSRALWLVGVVAFGVAVGCFRSGKKEGEQYDPEPTVNVPAEDLKALADGNNAFAIDLYKKVAEKHEGSLILSPYSISSALAMTYAGARGQTADQMRKVLHFTLPQDRLHSAFGGVTDSLQTAGKKRPYELNIANALWAQRGMKLGQEFADVTKTAYRAGVNEVDFSNSDAARATINRWIDQQTQGKVKDLLKPEDIDGFVRCVLVNAIYFKGKWEHPFDPALTRMGDFTTAAGTIVQVPMMHLPKTKIREKYGEDYSVAALPYAGDRLEMIIIVPRVGKSLREIEAAMTPAGLRQLLVGLSESELDVYIPRFKFENRVALKPILSQLGMPVAFSGGADFSGISSTEPLKIKDVIHGGSIELDEAGTTATAATAVLLQGISKPREFRADRAFMFLMRDRRTDHILLCGRVASPQ